MRLEYFEPSSVEEAVEILQRGGGSYKAFAGGTDIILQLRRRVKECGGLINVKRLPNIATWSLHPGKGLCIGAATPVRDLETSAEVSRQFPALADSLKVIGSIQLRNLATVGGNLCNASPAADTAPALMALGAQTIYVDNDSTPRAIPVERFFARPGSSVLGPYGLLLRVDVPEPQGMSGASFERLTPRHAMDIAIVSAASRVTLDGSGGRINDVAIALGAVAPTPIRAFRAEEVLRGREPTHDNLARAGAVAMEECRPIDDIRGSAAYRRAMVAVFVRRTLEQAIRQARGFSRV